MSSRHGSESYVKCLLHQVLSNDNFKYGYNAATGQYEDLMAAGIIDPTKVCGPSPMAFLSVCWNTSSWLILQLQSSMLVPYHCASLP